MSLSFLLKELNHTNINQALCVCLYVCEEVQTVSAVLRSAVRECEGYSQVKPTAFL